MNTMSITTTHLTTTVTDVETVSKASSDSLLNSIKPMFNDILTILEKHIDSTILEKHDDNDDNDVNDDPIMNELEENELKLKNSEQKENSVMNSTFDTLKNIFKDHDTYIDKPYLGMMPYTLKMLSMITAEDPEAMEIKNAATTLCEMLKDKDINQLYNVPEFKANVLKMCINYHKMTINILKNTIAKYESDLNSMNENTSLDALFKDLYNEFSKK